MTPQEADRLPVGVYRLFWIHSGRPSVAAVGRDRQGRVWYAPANWTDVPWYEWERVERAELVARSFEHTLGRGRAVTHTEIRSLRLALGMTQAELARYLGLRTVGAVAHMEAEPGTPGHRQPTGPVLRLLEILRATGGQTFLEKT